MKKGDFANWFAKNSQALWSGSESQFAGKGHLLIKRHVWKCRAPHPRCLNAAAIAGFGVCPTLRGVKIRADVARKARGFFLEFDAIETADGIFSIALNENPLRRASITVHRHLISVHSQFKKVRALETVWDSMMSVCPVQQICGIENECGKRRFRKELITQ